MAECAMCGTRVRGRKESLRLGSDKALHCFPCAEKWLLEDKKRLITELYEGRPPAELFCIKKVMIRDPYQKTKGLHLGGDLLFLDKAVCFVAVMEHTPPDTAAAGLLFGAIGAAIAQSRARKALKKAWEAVPGGGEERLTDDLARYLYDAKRLLVFPRQEVLGVGVSFWSGCGLKTVHKRIPLILENARKTLKPFKARVEEYLRG
jgi:hypothetical protein